MKSVWADNSSLPHFENLKTNLKTDVLVIGGGITGLLCAYMLSLSGVDCVLLEASKICGGVTENTTAKITSQHGLIYNKLIGQFGIEKARMYLEANQKALLKYRDLCEDIPCDFEDKASFVYSLDDAEIIEKEQSALYKIGYSADFIKNLSLPFSVAGAIRFNNQAQFNPLKFASAISKNLRIFEYSRVRELIGTTAVTDYGKITAEKIIVATHFPFINKHGSYFLKLYQHRSYVLALENAENVNGMYVDQADKGLSFRNYKNLLLLGGGSHRTGKKGGNWEELLAFADKHYPSAKVKYRFATQDCMTLDDVPYIGRYSARTDNLFVATGFNKWGMTSAMVSAMILCDMVQGKENAYAEVFSPSRTIIRPQLAVNAFEAVTNLITPTTKRCPHLGCALKWNPVERSWDCPCHGSRFTQKGHLIDNPANGNIEIK